MGILATSALLWVCGVAAAGKPQRVVSLSLCTDQLVLLLADRQQIASLSYMARDFDLSYLAADAATVPVNHGTAEEALILNPDLVLAGPWGSRQTGLVLGRLGYRVLFLPPADDFATIRAQLRQVAAELGQSERGARLIAAMDEVLAGGWATKPAASRPVTALPYSAGGYTQGEGTLMDSVLDASGLINIARRRGLSGFAPLALELALLERPGMLVVHSYRHDAPTAAKALLQHPALSRSGLAARAVNAPLPRLACGTPAAAAVVAEMMTLRERWPR